MERALVCTCASLQLSIYIYISILSMISRGFSDDVSPQIVLEKGSSNDERCPQCSIDAMPNEMLCG